MAAKKLTVPENLRSTNAVMDASNQHVPFLSPMYNALYAPVDAFVKKATSEQKIMVHVFRKANVQAQKLS